MNLALVRVPPLHRLPATHCANCSLFADADSTHQADCTLQAVCVSPTGTNEWDTLDPFMERGPTLQRGAVLFHDALPFSRIYVVRSGALKTVLMSRGGKEQVTGFCFPGDVLGLDSVGADCYRTTAVALESTTVCGASYASLRLMAGSLPGLQHYLLDLMSAALGSHHEALLCNGKSSAEERVALFLLALSARCKHRRLSENRLRLPMTRCDIGNYLGLALETISRILTRFQQLGVLEVQGRELHVIDGAHLRRIAQPTE